MEYALWPYGYALCTHSIPVIIKNENENTLALFISLACLLLMPNAFDV